ncbi:hypothetical protein AVME950_02080 [Acidovorax sp. SUPP950]|uniref:hypothetical protein n=1 Tax=Acidovorax sp. SUPP950 TaxID=511901 RepID=UPI0023CA46E9|nr:hypothetical protein [Acidovorax sp. SUPP950]GKS73634.1 hypothetical protein AVME950_02080 [Acidovorax sp. SUPP950]
MQQSKAYAKQRMAWKELTQPRKRALGAILQCRHVAQPVEIAAIPAGFAHGFVAWSGFYRR